MQIGVKLRLHFEMRELNDVVLFPRDKEGYPMGAYDESGKYIEKSGIRIYATDQFSTTENTLQDYDCLGGGTIDEPVIFAGYIRTHWGHFIVDGMSKMWWTNCENILSEHYKVVIFNELPSIYIEILEMMGIPCEQLLYINEPMRCRTIYFPELSYEPCHYISTEFYSTFQRVMLSIDQLDDVGRLYISKRKISKNSHHLEFGEEIVEHIFKENGYQVIYPEELSLYEQLQYYKSCSEIVSVNGTLAHNILWCRPTTRQIILKRFPDGNMHQPAINFMIGNPLRIIDCSLKGSYKRCSYLAITDDLKRFFYEENFIISYSRIKSMICMLEYYIVYGMKRIKHLFDRVDVDKVWLE